MQGCIRGLWAVDTNEAVQSDWVREVFAVLLKGLKERWVCLLIAVEQAPPLEQVCCDKPRSLFDYHHTASNHQYVHAHSNV